MLRVTKTALLLRPHLTPKLTHLRQFSTTGGENSGEEWNDAWETAWLPNDDLSNKTPWESDVDMTSVTTDAETKAFVDEMNDNWEQRRKGFKKQQDTRKVGDDNVGLYELGRLKSDYRLKKQRVHGGLWLKEIEKLEESKLSGGGGGGDDDIEKLLDSCSEIFDSPNNDLNNPKVPSTSEFKNKPDGWETTSKSEGGSVWDMSQREEDILLQEFERRMAFCKFQIASFIKTHIFSRRRPIDGWKYMIEVIGPNAKKGKGSVSRMPGLADPATQPFTEERPHASSRRLPSSRSR